MIDLRYKSNHTTMPIVKTVNNKKPAAGHDCWFADNSVIIGDVKLGRNCTLWFNTIIRGDVNSIVIGNNTNIQDGVIVHGTYEKAKVVIGSNVSIGHNAVIHGCTIEDNVLIGMGAVVMDNAVIKSGSVVGAGSVVLENTIIESSSVFAGNPAKKIRDAGQKEIEVIMKTAKNYIKYADWYK